MTLSPEDRKAIIDYRIERAYGALDEVDYVVKGKLFEVFNRHMNYASVWG